MTTTQHRDDTASNRRWQSAALKRWRKNNRRLFNRLLARLFGTATPRRRPLDANTRRILVIRLNKRLGNVLFLTPMLQTLAASLPAARIDVVIQDPAHKTLLESLPGIDHVWIQRKSLFAIIELYRRIRAQHYDLAIDPAGNSASNRLAIALCGARQRMGFAASDQWVSLTHASGRPASRHQAEQAVQLLNAATSDIEFTCFDMLAVFPDKRASRAALHHWAQALGETTGSRPVIGFFTRATGRKQLAESWWQAWYSAIRTEMPDALLLQIQPPGDHQPLAPDIPSLAIQPLEELAALLARLDVFVAADSGPMHLAAAAGVPVVGLFQATSPSAYAPLGRDCLSCSGEDLEPAQVARTAARLLAARHATVLARRAQGD